jgi:phage FluMu protein Com
MSPLSFSCPRCKRKDDLHRSRRRGFDWFMSKIGFKPVRCFACGKRFFVRQSLVKGEQQVGGQR